MREKPFSVLGRAPASPRARVDSGYLAFLLDEPLLQVPHAESQARHLGRALGRAVGGQGQLGAFRLVVAAEPTVGLLKVQQLLPKENREPAVYNWTRGAAFQGESTSPSGLCGPAIKRCD